LLSFDFKSKLQRLNPLLYVVDGVQVSSIYQRVQKRSDIKSNYNYLEREAAKLLEAQESGLVDEHICGIPKDFIPEWDEFKLDTGHIVRRGYRSILKILIEKKLCTLERARKVFNCPSLLEADFDRMTIPQKIARIKEDAQ